MKKIIVLAIAVMLALPSVTMAQKTTIQRITRESTYKTQTRSLSVWYQGEFSVGYAASVGDMQFVYEDGDTEKAKTDFSRPFIETVHGVRITQYAYAGLGLGFQYVYGKMNPDYSESTKWNTLLMPIFVNLKGYYPVTEDFAPYLSLSLGGSPALLSNWNESNEYEETKLVGGLYCKFGAGLSYKKFMFDFGVMHQGLTDKVTAKKYGDGYKNKMSINSVYFNLGVKF